MAVSQIYLQGGPCDGRTVSADQIVGGLVAYIKCGGGYYTDSGNTRANGDHIWTYIGKSPPTPPTTAGGASPRAHKAWAHLRHALNKEWPATIHASQKMTSAALRSLSHTRKV